MVSHLKAVDEFLPLVVLFTITAGLVFLTLYPDLPKIEAINEAPRQTGGQNYQEPPISNPQITIIPPPPAETITPDTDAQKAEIGILNAAIIAASAALGGAGVYFLLKRAAAKHILALALSLITLIAAVFFSDRALAQVKAIQEFLSEPLYRALALGALSFPLCVFVAVASGLNMSRKRRKTALAVFSSLSSALAAALIPVFAIFPLMLFMAAYDIYTVKHGPIRRTAQEGLSLLVAYEAEKWSLGLGDLIFYALLPSASLAYTVIHISRYAFYDFSPLVGILTPWAVFTTVAAATLTALHRSLNRRQESLIPGLPLPILAGCGAFTLCILILQLTNYLGWGWLAPIF